MPSVKNGLMMAAAMVGLYVVLFLIDPLMNYKVGMSFLIGFLHVGLGIFFVRQAILQTKEKSDGAISFGEAFAAGFGVIAIAYFIFHTVKFAHLQLDPDFYASVVQYSKDQAIAMMTKMTEAFNMEGADFDTAMAEINNQDFDIGVGTYIMGLLVGLVWPGAVIAVIMAAVIKKH